MVNLEPAVGRILLLRGRSTEPFPWYEKGGKIVRISGMRAYFTKEDGAESFTHEYSAVVDTEQEEARLLAFTALAKARLRKLLAELHTEAEARVTDINREWNKSKGLKSISSSSVRKAAEKSGQDPYLAGITARVTRTRK